MGSNRLEPVSVANTIRQSGHDRLSVVVRWGPDHDDKPTRYASADKRGHLRSVLDQPGRLRLHAHPIGGSSER